MTHLSLFKYLCTLNVECSSNVVDVVDVLTKMTKNGTFGPFLLFQFRLRPKYVFVYARNNPNKYTIFLTTKWYSSTLTINSHQFATFQFLSNEKKEKATTLNEIILFQGPDIHDNSITYYFDLNYHEYKQMKLNNEANSIHRQDVSVVGEHLIEYMYCINLRGIHFANLFVINYFRSINFDRRARRALSL